MPKGKREIIEGTELANQESIRTLGDEKKNNKYLGVLENGLHQSNGNEKKRKNKSPSEEQKNFSKTNSTTEI